MVFYTSTSTDEICDYVMHGQISPIDFHPVIYRMKVNCAR